MKISSVMHNRVADYINYQDGDEFPQPCIVLAKDLVKIRINKMGAEGLESQNYGTHSEGYIDGLPDDIKRKLQDTESCRGFKLCLSTQICS